MPKKRSTKKTDESKRAERKKLMETDTHRQGDTPTQPEPKIPNRRGRPAPCRHAATQVVGSYRDGAGFACHAGLFYATATGLKS